MEENFFTENFFTENLALRAIRHISVFVIRAATQLAGSAVREGEGIALTTQHTPLKSMEGELIRRSDIDALIKALKENAMREAEGRALTTQHTPLKSMEGELIRRSDIDALIKALKENGNDIGNTLGYSFAASYLDRTRVHLSSEIETKCSDSPDQRVIHDGDSSEVTDQNKGTQQPVPVKEEEEMQPDVEEVQSDVPRAASDPVVEVVASVWRLGRGEVDAVQGPYQAVRLGRASLDQRQGEVSQAVHGRTWPYIRPYGQGGLISTKGREELSGQAGTAGKTSRVGERRIEKRNEVCGDLGEVKSTRPYMVVQEAVRLGRTELDQRLAQLEREKQPYPHFTYVENIIGQF
ncbi:hypothetical protein F2Q70_00022272 [Brassica cretica]|uniref:Uncharacterized protein n=1 Tax=Brassica cretica TaxID=69181 RepID=A0A8S9GVU9_BRACR|nr:hypothetical protein F2Q70_00022272 [Brassica cretica]